MVSSNEEVWVTHLSETGVRVAFEGDLAEWEDVRLQMSTQKGRRFPGRNDGKVTQVQPGAAGGLESHHPLHFGGAGGLSDYSPAPNAAASRRRPSKAHFNPSFPFYCFCSGDGARW